ncbi:subtilisin-like protein [Coniophora puteana RWD-64-598 SS2]|uniref:tripeptidyl-peptidase II n=1 Tax=Coniophora puteana (strain RWD-64-598) TaxID=741705 RepID=A0A5M3MN39_CONPW|nr:subtilisin-like protein [Coniophora puteana RWD-64-598 SS2]EIW80513.1 subtilisin-like protein [Coniophora puteana RWD-64-598 SS2]
MRSLLSLVALSLSLFAAAEPTISPYALHEKRIVLPQGWSYGRKHAAGSALPLRFALTQQNIEEMEKYVMDVSHPHSPNYGKHWSVKDVLEKFSPNRETVKTVHDWLTENGIEKERIRLSPNKGWIEVDATIEEAEALLQTEYSVYSHVSGKEHVGCSEYHLPSHVKRHVDFVTPTVHFDARLTSRSSETTPQTQPQSVIPKSFRGGPKSAGKYAESIVPTDLSTCYEYITPDCLRALYSLNYTPVATADNTYGIVEYTPEAYLQTDLDMFATNFSTDLYGVAPYMVSIDGGYAQTEYQNFSYNGESDLDLEYGMTLVGSEQTVTLYQAGDMVEGASFNNFLDAIDGTYCTFEGGNNYTQDAYYPDPYGGGYEGPQDCGTAKPTNVISTSYAYNEADLTEFYAARQCAEYAKLGLMGVTVLYSSGDYGVAGNDALCLFPNGTQSVNGTLFNPTFPSTCPYVTSVGATMMKPNATVYQYQPEMACEEVIYSGGGFSNYFAMPSYQAEAVEYYLKTYPPDVPSYMYNTSGSRAYPDISANGANYVVAIDGEFELVYGTSCASPVNGAIFTMINDARLAAGKSTIGFINPTIYTTNFAALFNDITLGDNPGCGTDGFNATPGWDPVTGLGTLNFTKLVAAWLELS